MPPSALSDGALRDRRRQALGASVRQARLERGWTQEQLAQETGFDRKSVNRVETGAYAPSVDRLFVLAEALGTTAARLLAGIE